MEVSESSAEYGSTLGTVGSGQVSCGGADCEAVLLCLLGRGTGKARNIVSHHVWKQVCLKDAEC